MSGLPLGRRRFIGMVGTAVGAAAVSRPGTASAQDAAWRLGGGPVRRAFVGTFTTGPNAAPGIGLAGVEASGRIHLDGYHVGVENPFYLAQSRDVLYACSDVASGRVHALRIGPDGGLASLNDQPSAGAGPVFLGVHPDGRHLLTTNYDSGSVVVHPIDRDGALGAPVEVVTHVGSGPNPVEQLGPHPHMAVADPTGRRVLVPDKGTDFVYVYRFDTSTGRLTPQSQVYLGAGVGPRHLVFHPSGRHVFVVNELGSSVTVCGYDPATGALWTLDAVPTVPPGTDPRNAPSAIVLSPDARFCYVANRGLDAVAALAVQAGGRRLRLTGLTPVTGLPPGGSLPWDLAIHPSGRLLYAANMAAGSVVTFQVDPHTGALRPVNEPVAVSSPVRILLR